MANVITEYEQTTSGVEWAKNYIYGGQGEVIMMQLPKTAAANTAFDNLMLFATAWLCYPSCTAQQLTWDTNSDDQINLYDYVDNTDYFEGAFITNYRYLLTDKSNSVVGVVDADGAIEYISYNAWGVPSYSGDTGGLSVLWNGYYFDNETENYYLRNRYYSSTQRKFLTDDPRGIIPDGNWNNPFAIMNQYADGVGLMVYAGANPVMNRDDWGLYGDIYDPGNGYMLVQPSSPDKKIENKLKKICDTYKCCKDCKKDACYGAARQLAQSYYAKLSAWIKSRDDEWRSGIRDGESRFPFRGRYNYCFDYAGAIGGFGLSSGCFSLKKANDTTNFSGHQYIGVFHACNGTNHSDANLDPWTFGDWYHAPRIISGTGGDIWE